MRSTVEVKKRLEEVNEKLNWLNEILRDESKLTEDVVTKSGKVITGYKYSEYLAATVRERMTLEWVLCINP